MAASAVECQSVTAEQALDTEEVDGSSPFGPTTYFCNLLRGERHPPEVGPVFHDLPSKLGYFRTRPASGLAWKGDPFDLVVVNANIPYVVCAPHTD